MTGAHLAALALLRGAAGCNAGYYDAGQSTERTPLQAPDDVDTNGDAAGDGFDTDGFDTGDEGGEDAPGDGGVKFDLPPAPPPKAFRVHVFLNDGAGGWSLANDFDGPDDVRDVLTLRGAPGAVDGIAIGAGTDDRALFRYAAPATSDASATIAVSPYGAIVAGDLDADGDDDLATLTDDSLYGFRTDPMALVEAWQAQLPTPVSGRAVMIADVDDDGLEDALAIRGEGSSSCGSGTAQFLLVDDLTGVAEVSLTEKFGAPALDGTFVEARPRVATVGDVPALFVADSPAGGLTRLPPGAIPGTFADPEPVAGLDGVAARLALARGTLEGDLMAVRVTGVDGETAEAVELWRITADGAATELAAVSTDMVFRPLPFEDRPAFATIRAGAEAVDVWRVDAGIASVEATVEPDPQLGVGVFLLTSGDFDGDGNEDLVTVSEVPPGGTDDDWRPRLGLETPSPQTRCPPP